MFDLEGYVEGDEFEGSPAYLGKVISAILAAGGTLDYEGSSVVLTSLPNRKTVEAVTVVPEPVVPEPVVPEPVIPEPVIPEPVIPEPVVPEPVVPEPVVPEPVVPEPAPKAAPKTAKRKSYGVSRKTSSSS